MEPKSTGKRIKTRACKSVTPYVVYSNSDSSEAKTFVNSDTQKRFTNFFAFRSVLCERGFNFDL